MTGRMGKPKVIQPYRQTKTTTLPKTVVRPLTQDLRVRAEGIRRDRELTSAPGQNVQSGAKRG